MTELYKPPLQRKLDYVKWLASLLGIDLSMNRWLSFLNNIMFSIGFNLSLRFNLDFHLTLNYHFEIPEFPKQPWEKVEKARYGISRYGKAIYDPEQVSSESLEGMSWDFRYKVLDPTFPVYKHTGQTLVNYMDYLIDVLTEKNVREEYVHGIFDSVSVMEAKTINVSYVGFNVVGVAKVAPKKRRVGGRISYYASKLRMRSPTDWTTEVELDTIGIYDTWVGYSRVGYSRVAPKDGVVSKAFSTELNNRVEGFRQRSGMVKITKGLDVEVPDEIREITKNIKGADKTLYQRVFFYQKMDKMHWTGGKHQIRLQTVINKVKKILNDWGVIAQFRGAYIAFAQELYYLYYSPHRKYKQWKKILTDDDLVEKYKRFGCDVNLLKKIKEVVSAWRQPEMQPV